MAAKTSDVFSYLEHQHPRLHKNSKSLVNMTYLADWRSSLQRGRQISDTLWCFLIGPTAFSEPETPSNISSSGALLGQDWPTLCEGDLAVLDAVISETRDLSPIEICQVSQETFPASTVGRLIPLDLPALAQEYIQNQSSFADRSVIAV